MASWSREAIFPLYFALMKTHLEYCLISSTQDMNLLEWVQRKVTKMIRGMEHISFEDKPRKLRLLSLEKRLR